jgi:hypothetical protein
LPWSVYVEADSLFEAAAAGLEQLHNNGGLITQVLVTVLEPGKRYKVHPQQLEKWLRSYQRADSVGVRALKARIRGMLQRNPTK